MPRLSDSMEEGTILKWLVSEGDATPGLAGRLTVEARPLLMSSVEAAADIAGAAVDLGTRLAARVRA